MKRFLKIVAILTLFAVVIAYVAFRVVFFDPFGGARAALDPLIPKDVDVMVRRKALANDFEPFPMPRFFKTLRLKDEWEALSRTRLWRELEPKLGVERAFAELEKLPAQIQPLDVMQDLAGREALAMARWRADGTLAWAVITRGSFRTKLLAEALKFGVARRAAGDVIADYAEKEGVKSFTVKNQGQTLRLHLARSEDAVIVGNDFELVRAVVALDADPALSLDKSPQYRSAILGPAAVGRSIDFVVDVAEVCKRLGVAWPQTPNEEPLVRFAHELLAPERFGQAMGRLELGNQIELSMSVAADRVALKPVAGGLLDGTSARLADLHQFCGKVFPSKVAVCGYVRLDVKEFLRRMESLLAPDVRQLLNDFVANLKTSDQQFQPKSIVELLDAFSGVVADELAFAIEPGEAYHVPGTEEGEMQFHDPHWGPRIALIFPVGEKEMATTFVDRLVKALSGRQNAISNVWKWGYPGGGPEFREIKSVDSDRPTVSIGVMELQKKDCVVITTTGAFLDEIVHQKLNAERGATSGLQSELQFRQSAEAVGGFGQGFVFVSSPNLRKVVADYCVVMAEEATRPDWTKLRKEIERQVVAKSFPELVNHFLDETARRKVDPLVDAEIDKREKAWKEVALPEKVEELRTDLDAFDMLRWAVLSLRIDERDLSLRMRLATPANFATDDYEGR